MCACVLYIVVCVCVSHIFPFTFIRPFTSVLNVRPPGKRFNNYSPDTKVVSYSYGAVLVETKKCTVCIVFLFSSYSICSALRSPTKKVV